MNRRLRGAVVGKVVGLLAIAILIMIGWQLRSPDDAPERAPPVIASDLVRTNPLVGEGDKDPTGPLDESPAAHDRRAVETIATRATHSRFGGTSGGQVRGRFTRADAAIADSPIHIELVGREPEVREARQEVDTSDGTFVIDVALAGRYALSAHSASRELGAAIDGIDCRDGGVVDLGAIELRVAWTLSGRVVDTQSIGVKNARVVAGASTTVSDAAGRFVLEHVADGVAAIDVSATGYVSATFSFAEFTKANLVIEMAAQVAVAGIVLDANEQPAPGATIWFQGHSVVADERGRFSLAELDPRAVSNAVAFVRHPTAGHAEVQLDPSAANVVHLAKNVFATIEIEPPSAFDPRARTILERFLFLPTGEARYFSDHGLGAQFAAPNLLRVGPLEASQRYSVAVETTRGDFGRLEFETSATTAEVADAILRLAPAWTLAGTVLSASGEPLADAVIVARPARPAFLDERLPDAVTRTDASGRFRLSGLRTADLDLVVRHPSCAAFCAAAVAGQDVVLQAPGDAALTVIVEGFDPAIGPIVVEVRNEATRDVVRSMLSERGEARFEALASGTARVVVRSEDRSLRDLEFMQLARAIELTAGRTSETRFLAAELPIAELHVTVVDSTGAPLPALIVAAYGAQASWGRWSPTDARGIARLSRIPFGRARVSVDPVPEIAVEVGAGIYAQVEVGSRITATRIVATIGALDLTLVDSQEKPIGHAEIRLEFEREADRSFGSIASEYTDDAGRLSFPRLPAGTYRVFGPGQTAATCVVTDRQQTSLRMVLTP